MKLKLMAFFAFIVFRTDAQKAFEFGQLPVQISEKQLSMPFAGGINAAQIQQLDLNGDGEEELVIWDRNAGNLLVFENVEGDYVHRPEFQYYFPEDINGFLKLADFDGDARKDIFTSSPFGIKVYRNTTAAGLPQWEVAQEFLRLDNNANLQTNNLDIPAILDIDGDGDLDIVTFNFASGDFLEYYQNTSMERKGSPDVDGFATAVTRWGGFEFCSCNNFSFGRTCDGRPIAQMQSASENFRIKHAGGHSLLLQDFDGDGILDILMGQDECNILYFLVNEGSNESPDFKAFSRELPQVGSLPEFPVFHAANLLSGQDLVVSTNSSYTASQYDADYSQSLYRFQGGALTTRSFLQEDMVDLGENSRPFFKGNATSGELIVTANSLVDQKIIGKVYHFRLSSDGLTLMDEDFLNLSSLNLTDLQYLEILAADNRRSLFVSGVETVNFTAVRKLFWSVSLDGKGLREIDLPGVRLRGNDHLEFYSHQGENFLLLARQTGELIRYQLDFGTVPEIKLLDRDFLGFQDNPAHRNLAVHAVMSKEGHPDLFFADQNGALGYISDFLNSSDVYTDLLRIGENRTVATRFGRNTWITSLPSALGESRDLVIGNTSGGLIYLKDISKNNIPPDRDLQLKIYPNPSTGPLTIVSSGSGLVNVINTMGQVVLEDISIERNIPLELGPVYLASGVYIIELSTDSGDRTVRKWIVRH